MHPAFKLTVEKSLEKITFLDVEIFKGPRHNQENILDIKTHTKLIDTFQYLHRESLHPKSTFKGLIKGEILRYSLTCNNLNDFKKKVCFLPAN